MVERRIADRDAARPQRERLPLLDLQLGGEIGEAQLRSGQVDQHGDVGAVGARPPDAVRLCTGPRVRQVHAQDVDARVEQALERARRILRGTEGGDDLRAALGHRRRLYSS